CQKPAFSVAKTGSSGTPLQTSRPCGRWVIGGFSGATNAVKMAEEKERLTRHARSRNRGMSDLDQLWNYIETHKESLI
ncbi:hypothetical protein JWH08_15265, partial [Xanthomonas campestris pv. campestris]|nr:hypothetical protein [Xanthomonas campestris pv. campestris]MCD0263890.1 hypothetical protein [Xanthomonas campestris pv. campestris]